MNRYFAFISILSFTLALKAQHNSETFWACPKEQSGAFYCTDQQANAGGSIIRENVDLTFNRWTPLGMKSCHQENSSSGLCKGINGNIMMFYWGNIDEHVQNDVTLQFLNIEGSNVGEMVLKPDMITAKLQNQEAS